MDFDLFTRYFLAAFFLMIGVLFSCRVLGQQQRVGYAVIHYGASRSGTWWHRQLFNFFRAAILGICVVRVIWPEVDGWLGILPWLYQPVVLFVGVLLLLIAFGLVSFIQGFLGSDWRSGIDTSHPPPLITEGPFRYSRNPTYLAVMTAQLGFFLALPSLFSLACLVVGVAVLMRQALSEERELTRLHGPAYRAYCEKVPRWLARL
ncbi:methyltransferase family protein [Nitrincola sp. MINF-07-Sa-05]|uniref:methyltransferase family protein n=1 Tax=Nitrincola salilacus TaxID=3400273 RepID=UPI0039181DC4